MRGCHLSEFALENVRRHSALVKSFLPLIKNMSVFSPNEFYSSHVSVMNEWNINYFVTKTFMKFGSVIFYRSSDNVTKSAGSKLYIQYNIQ